MIPIKARQKSLIINKIRFEIFQKRKYLCGKIYVTQPNIYKDVVYNVYISRFLQKILNL